MGTDDAHMDFTGPFGPNWAVLLLPYIEQTPLFTQALNVTSFPGVPVVVNGSPPAGVNLSWRVVVGTPIKTFLCPQHQQPDAIFQLGGPRCRERLERGNYGVTAGYEDYDHVAGGATFASSKKQVAGANGLVSSPVMSSNFETGPRSRTSPTARRTRHWLASCTPD